MRRFLYAALLMSCWACLFAPEGTDAAESRFDEPQEYRIESASLALSSTQAGAHADFTTNFELSEKEGIPYALARDVIVKLPPGFAGNTKAFPECTTLEFDNGECPQDSQVGSTDLKVSGVSFNNEPVYNMVPPGGDVVARFGFIAYIYPTILNVRLDPETEALVASVEGAASKAWLVGSSFTTWGVPASPIHDFERITPSEAFNQEVPPGGRKSDLPEVPFMTNPTDCGDLGDVTISTDSYQAPGSFVSKSVPFPRMTGCGLVEFNPSVSVKPTTSQASTGTGLDYELAFPTKGLEFGNLYSSSQVKRVEVLLPEGVTINPSEAAGLGVCTEEELAKETYKAIPNQGCPETSKIGSVEAITPVIDRNAVGSLYLAKPYANQFGTLLALYAVLKIPDRGVLVRLKGEVIPDPVTGRLTTIFDDSPQLPVATFHMHFREGARAPLVTPASCGSYTTVSRMEPWSAPGTETVRETSFEITKGVNNGPCPPAGVPPFAPTAIGGTSNNLAGSYSPFYMRIERQDGEQEITGFSTQMPLGLTANLTGVPFCGEAEIEHARRQSGVEAEESSSCPAASQIGRTISDAGVGSTLVQAPGRLYLAGPFEGAPFSVVDITSAHVGPFDLGTVVVHLPLHIDPVTAQASIPAGQPDQIPHIIKGIVIHLRAIRVYIDREHFIINPTNCQRMTLTATPIGSGASFTSPADDQAATASVPFQEAECSSLAFNPGFTAATVGRPTRKVGVGLHVKLTYPSGSLGSQANIRSVKVTLPRQLPSRLSTLQQACADSVFNADPAGCPSASRVGVAKATTPILPVPLTGPAYFVSHGGKEFPELVIVLQGYGVTVDLHGETFISKAGVTSSTFRTVPDVPVGSFELDLPQGPFSALAANGDLCNVTKTVLVKRKARVRSKGRSRVVTRTVKKRVATPLEMPTAFTAQNGAVIHRNTPIAAGGCVRHKSAKPKAKVKRK